MEHNLKKLIISSPIMLKEPQWSPFNFSILQKR
jgi:hypothetical protein